MKRTENLSQTKKAKDLQNFERSSAEKKKRELNEEAGSAPGAHKWNLGRAFKRHSSAEHGFMPALTHWVNLLLPGGDP